MPTTTNYIWDEQNYLAESDGTNTINVVYTNEPQQYGNLVSTRIASETLYHHFDAIGSTRQLTNAVGHVTDIAIYDAWGNVANRIGTTVCTFLWVGATGYYFDAELSSFYVRRRPYVPAAARWTTFDPLPLQTISLLNVYRYANSQPVSQTDPSGLESFVATISGKECDACGKFALKITYDLAPESKLKRVFVVQYVCRFVQRYNCVFDQDDKCCVYNNVTETASCCYYELLGIIDKAAGLPLPLDNWGGVGGGIPVTKCVSNGWELVMAIVKGFEEKGSDVAGSTADWDQFPQNNVPCGDFPVSQMGTITSDEPDWWNDHDVGATSMVYAAWNCCDGHAANAGYMIADQSGRISCE